LAQAKIDGRGEAAGEAFRVVAQVGMLVAQQVPDQLGGDLGLGRSHTDSGSQ
jgi:hypothetical protein